MASVIAEYYTGELAEWSRLIDFYNHEMDEFEDKLGEVIQRNSIPGIAAKVEQHQDKLNAVSGAFYSLQNQMLQQKVRLLSDNTLIDDALVNEETEMKQNELRKSMQAIEKDYVDVKYACYEFLSGTLKK